MGIGCTHWDRYTDTGDEGTSHCVYCRCLAAEAEVERLQQQLDCYVAMKEGVGIRIGDLEAEIERLRSLDPTGWSRLYKRKQDEVNRLQGELSDQRNDNAAIGARLETIREQRVQIGELEAEVKRLREALRAIVKHQEEIGGGLATLSVTRRIALVALDGQAENGGK